MKRREWVGAMVVAASTWVFGGANSVPPNADIAPVVDPTWGVALKAGTLGVGLDFTRPINDTFALRVNVNGLKIHDVNVDLKKYIDVDIDGVDTLANVDYLNAGLLLDWHPFQNPFLISAGAYYTDNSVSLVAKPKGKNIRFEGEDIDNNTVDTITSTLSANKYAPYLGIGYNKISESGWAFSWDLGVMYQGTPSVKTTVKYMAGATAGDKRTVEDSRKQADKEANKKIADYSVAKFYPVLRVGLSYNF
jgi:hypothetical protein